MRNGVRLSVTAPPDVPLHREEINTEIRDSNRGAATARKALDVLGARLRGCS
jgi:sRNA-binding carbon storage regulator CsrA